MIIKTKRDLPMLERKLISRSLSPKMEPTYAIKGKTKKQMYKPDLGMEVSHTIGLLSIVHTNWV